jgi:hypothetical protein
MPAIRTPSTSTWPYGEHSNLEVVADRDTYRTQMAPRRAQRLRDMMGAHRPRYVVFLGSTYREHWERVAGRRPAARGSTNGEFEQLGRALAAV